MHSVLKFLIVVTMFFTSLISYADAKLKVVTTLSTFADLVKTVGGDEVEVSYIAPPRFNPHFIEPRPSDVLKVKRAELFIHAGLDLELWRWPLVDAAGNAEVRPGGSRELALSHGVRLLEVPSAAPTRAAGDIHIYGNPHYWVHPENVTAMVQTICDKLCALDPGHGQIYQKNLKAFEEKLNQKIAIWRSQLEPFRNQELIGYHNQWPYLMEFAGLKMDYFLEPKPGIPPTPRQIEFVEGRIRNLKLRGIVQATYLPDESSQAVAKHTGAKVIFLCENVEELPQATDYIAMMDYNVKQLVEAFSK